MCCVIVVVAIVLGGGCVCDGGGHVVVAVVGILPNSPRLLLCILRVFPYCFNVCSALPPPKRSSPIQDDCNHHLPGSQPWLGEALAWLLP